MSYAQTHESNEILSLLNGCKKNNSFSLSYNFGDACVT